MSFGVLGFRFFIARFAAETCYPLQVEILWGALSPVEEGGVLKLCA